jgi:hypothetical protein
VPTGLRQAVREDAPCRAAPKDQVVEIAHQWDAGSVAATLASASW